MYISTHISGMLLSRASRTRFNIHAVSLEKVLFFLCRGSIYRINQADFFLYGKGSVSRSEPLYQHPNPCFNSIGRVGREQKPYFRRFNEFKRTEFLILHLFEIFLQKEKINFNKKLKNSFRKIKEDFLKIHLISFSELLFNRLGGSLKINLKTGIKFGGRFLAYLYPKSIKSHVHSFALISQNEFGYKKKKCLNCMSRCPFDSDNIQTSSRLSQHVSKVNLNSNLSLFRVHFGLDFRVLLINQDLNLKRSKI